MTDDVIFDDLPTELEPTTLDDMIAVGQNGEVPQSDRESCLDCGDMLTGAPVRCMPCCHRAVDAWLERRPGAAS